MRLALFRRPARPAPHRSRCSRGSVVESYRALQRVWITAAELEGAAAGAFVLRRPTVRAPSQPETDVAERAAEGTA